MKLILIDDHPLFLDALHRVLTNEVGDAEIATFDNAADALVQLERDNDVDLLLVDLEMPGMDGYAFLQAIATRRLVVPVVVLAATENVEDIRRALDYGAVGFIPKTLSARETLAAIHTVLNEGEYLPQSVRKALHHAHDTKDRPRRLSPRQIDVLKLISKGYTNKGIADTLAISEPTVKTHVQALMNILGANNRTQCIVEALKLELISPG